MRYEHSMYVSHIHIMGMLQDVAQGLINGASDKNRIYS